MGLLDKIFRKAIVTRPASDQPAAPYAPLMPVSYPLVAYAEILAAAEAMRHPVLYRCLEKISSAVRGVTWYCEQDSSFPQSMLNKTTENKINDLLKMPSDNLTAGQLRSWIALSYALFGRAPFKVGVSVEGYANGVYPLAAAHTRAKTDARGTVIGYEYGSGATQETLSTRRFAVPGGPYAYEIAKLSLDGGVDPAQVLSPLRALAMPAQITRLLLQRAVDTASGHPNWKYLVSTEKTLTEKQKQNIREHIEDARAGGDDSGQVLFLSNTTVTVNKLDNAMTDIHSKIPMDDMSRMIAGCLGVPIPLLGLGAADAAKFAGNFAEARMSFWEETIIPGYLEPIAEGMTVALCPPGYKIRFDHDTIPALADGRIKRAKDLETVTFLTRDEKRELAGFAPLTDEQKADLAENAKPATTSTTNTQDPANPVAPPTV